MTIDPVLGVLFGLGVLILGSAVGFFARRKVAGKKLVDEERRTQELLQDAHAKAAAIRKEAELEVKDAKLKAREAFEQEVAGRQKEIQQTERRVQQREDHLEKRLTQLEQKEEELKRTEQSVADRKEHAEKLEKQYMEMVGQARKALEKAAGLSAEEAKRELRQSLIDDARQEAAKEMKNIEDELKESATRKSQEIISTTIERLASDYVADRVISVVQLPGDEMKGRIIGREGRNIRALEAATGIDFIIDDTPEAVILSGFNPIRREVARITLENLIADGRIHPTRIEEMVEKVTKEVNTTIRETGEKVCLDLNLRKVHPELIKLIGTLKYRFSYAQNVLQHSIEVAHICGMIAAELGLDEEKARRAGLMHDMGKAVTHEVEGGHALIGMDWAKRYGESPDVCHAIGAHHEDIPQDTALDLIVDASDALSGARPGARREVLEAYVKRLEDLEKISTSFSGVEKAYAIQAGREIRVMVDHGKIDDTQAVVLCRDIAKKIENDMTYPGHIKVTVIRETRATEYAK